MKTVRTLDTGVAAAVVAWVAHIPALIALLRNQTLWNLPARARVRIKGLAAAAAEVLAGDGMERVLHLGKTHDEVFHGEVSEKIPYHRMYGKEYCAPSVIQFTKEEIEAITTASETVDRIYWKVLRFVQQYMPDSFLVNQLGIHPALVQAARLEVPYHGVSRQDWIITPDGMKCIENNTDTPSGIPETAYLAGELVGKYTSLTPSSKSMRSTIQLSFQTLLDYYRSSGLEGIVAFSSYGTHIEDKTNTEYLREAVADLGYETMFVPLDELEIIPGDGLFADGKRISVLYRLYPLEYLVHDTDEESGQKVGEDLLSLVMEGKLGLINPVQSIITQSKGFMALIWSLYERNDETAEFCGFTLFDDDDMQSIETYLLPTYFENSVFVQEGTPFVAKGYWGREGKGTSLFDESGTLLQAEWGSDEEDREEVQEYYDNQPKIFQKQFPLQAIHILTENGPYSGYLLTGAYVIGGQYCGLLPRIGGKITGDMAYYCPAAITN